MISLLKEVGRGKRGAKDLSYDEALRAAELIIQSEATPAQIGAFLVAERIKMESPEEILAFIHSLQKHSIKHPIPGGIDCAGPYDGRNKSFQATIASSFVLSACGLPATLHGTSSLPPKWGTTLLDTMILLGAPAGPTPKESWINAAKESGFMFIPTESWCPPLANLRSIREELGLRTVFNTAEKLLRLTSAAYMVIGVFHGTVFDKMANLLIELKVDKALIVQGTEGSEDLTVDKRTRTLIVQDGKSDLHIIDPEVLGLQAEMPEIEWNAANQALYTLEVLQNKSVTAVRNSVILNSAVRLWIADKVDTIEEGIERAAYALEEGMAWNKYQAWLKSISGQEASSAAEKRS
jgi:anthranilate phosphoribosyltransferase